MNNRQILAYIRIATACDTTKWYFVR